MVRKSKKGNLWMKTKERSRGRIARAKSAISNLFKGRADEPDLIEHAADDPGAVTRAASTPENATARPAKRLTDIPMNVLESTYTPASTSSKASFRSDGSDHQDDQEFAAGVADERWKDEDRYTNKSGDPRIGTHGRTYDPAEKR